jgi:excinuclease UvrABC nuclease subunit
MANWELKWSTLHILNEENIQQLADIPGVYRLSSRGKDSNAYVFFVGKSENIKPTLLEHLKNEKKICIKNYIESSVCFFRYAQISQEEVRSAAERQVYKYYQPTCNDVIPEGSDIILVNVT